MYASAMKVHSSGASYGLMGSSSPPPNLARVLPNLTEHFYVCERESDITTRSVLSCRESTEIPAGKLMRRSLDP